MEFVRVFNGDLILHSSFFIKKSRTAKDVRVFNEDLILHSSFFILHLNKTDEHQIK